MVTQEQEVYQIRSMPLLYDANICTNANPHQLQHEDEKWQ